MFGIVVESTLSRGTSFAGAARQAEPEERRALRHCDGVDKADAGPKKCMSRDSVYNGSHGR